MKRILFLVITVLGIMLGATKARQYYIPLSYRVRHSPHAFDFKGTSLVAGNVRYSPYAFDNNNTGLVVENLRYSPYAFGHNRTGLVADYYYCGCYTYHRPCLVDGGASPSEYIIGPKCTTYVNKTKKNYKTNCKKDAKARRDSNFQLERTSSAVFFKREINGKDIIYKYLRSKKIDFKMDKGLTIDNTTLSINFVLKDKKVIIKYWNLKDVDKIIQQSDSRENIYNKYRKDWRALLDSYKKASVKVYEVSSEDEKEILNRLALWVDSNAK